MLSILNGTSLPHPYVLFGPPGTGKTVTLVESIKQVWKNKKKSRILVAAPSNTAVDLLASRLLEHVPSAEIVRLNASSREKLPVDEDLRAICQSTGIDTRIKSEVRIVCATLVTCGSRYLKTSGFTHVFIDEAGQAMEPEVLIPLQMRLRWAGEVVLAGDPNQLGPVVKSEIGKKLGLDLSFLKRLMTNFAMYQADSNGEFDSRFVTILVRNFRSNEKILEFPSQRFYDGKLEACAAPEITTLFKKFDWIKNKECPIMFKGVKGRHLKDGQSPSLYNDAEIAVVMEYVHMLVRQIDHAQIGVITPYKRHARMIKEALEKAFGQSLANKILVGSTEQFQGQERLVMLISTVRTSTDLNGNPTRQLGFLVSPQRFNVSVTRAQSFLIVIGDPHLLSRDQCWGDFLEHAIANKAYVGCPIASRTRKPF